MGKASSAKKVARASRAGGRTKGQRRSFGFPAAIVAICLLGLGLVAFARADGSNDGPPELGDHWHAAFGVYVCDRWVQNFSDRAGDAVGIHTHDDGLIHIHPKLAGAAGSSATFGKFFDEIGLTVTDTSLILPPGDPYNEREYREGETSCGGEAATLQMASWDDAREAASDPKIRTSGFDGIHFDIDFAAYTLAFVPEGTEIPPPPSASSITEGATVDGGSAPEGSDLSEEELEQLFQEQEAGEDTGEDPVDDTTTVPADTTEPTETTEAPADGG